MEILEAFIEQGISKQVCMIKDDECGIWFNANDIASVLGIKNIRQSLASFSEKQKTMKTIQTPGGAQSVLFLSEQGVYKLIMRSRKPNVELFQDWVSDVVCKIRKEGFFKLPVPDNTTFEENKQHCFQLAADEIKAIEIKSKHQTILDHCRFQSLVYFGFIAMLNGKMLIKIGSTNNIGNRINGLENEFGSMFFIHVFECSMYTQFERFLQKHNIIQPLVYREPLPNGHVSTCEVFLMDKDDLERSILIAKHNVGKFRSEDLTQEIEFKKAQAEYLKLELENKKLEAANQEEKDMLDRIYTPLLEATTQEIRRFRASRGDKIQRYSSDGKVLIRTYEGVIEACRDREVDNPSPSQIKHAAEEKHIYKSYRWAFLDRDKPDETIQDIGETEESKTVRKGFVAMINLQKTAIVKVFCDQKEAYQDRGFKGCAAISKAIQQGTKSGGHYFQMWTDCDEELKSKYLYSNTLPSKRVCGMMVAIAQLHPATKEPLKTYSSLADIQKEFKVSRKTMKQAIEHQYLLRGYLWKYA